MVIGMNIKKAGIFINPILNGKLAFKNDPDIKKPTAPNKAIIKPMAAALPIALFIGYPKYLKTGTFKIAPPIPIGAEIKPDTKPKTTLGINLKFIFILSVLSLIFKRYAPKI
tara:strand:- start:19 stop:354 length:336 start_codon:yes stop_codon:yes gene_type:complete